VGQVSMRPAVEKTVPSVPGKNEWPPMNADKR